jgi:hypothetical protein
MPKGYGVKYLCEQLLAYTLSHVTYRKPSNVIRVESPKRAEQLRAAKVRVTALARLNCVRNNTTVDEDDCWD